MNEADNSVKNLLSGQGKAIPLFKVFMPKSIIKPLQNVLFSGYIGEGPVVKEFERQLSLRFGNNNVLALNNGTSALQLALRLAGVGPQDEVISTPMTCVATNQPILAMGARIVWADIDPLTGNIDTNSVAKKITSKTKAIMVVHWGGYPCDLNELNQLASSQGIKLIEDACHAFGATYYNKPIGSHSDFVCFSFQAIKEMTTVDGGALVCKSKKDYERGKLLRWYGIDREKNCRDFRCEDDIVEYGYKFHMNDVTAAIGIEQLKHVDNTIKKHRMHAAYYNEAFRNLKTVKILKYRTDRLSSYWLYTLRVKYRGNFIETMEKAGIVVSQVHARNDKHTIFKNFMTALPGVDEFSSEHICIPVGWWLTEKTLSYIADTIIKHELSAVAKELVCE